MASFRLVALGDAAPVGHARAAQRVRAQRQAGALHGVQIQHRAQIVDIGGNVIVAVRCRRRPAPAAKVTRADRAESFRQDLVGTVLNGLGGAGIGGPAVGRVVFEAAIVGRIVRGRDHDAVGQSAGAPAIVAEHRVRERRGRRVSQCLVHHHLDIVGRQHLERAGEGGLGEGVSILGQEQGTIGAVGRPVFTDGLGNRQDVAFVERAVEGGAAVSAGAEAHALRRPPPGRAVRCNRQ